MNHQTTCVAINRTSPRRSRPRRRGFALMMVMLIVAFVGLGAAALLDLVNVDLGIAVEHRKLLDAQAASVGAILESVGETNFVTRLPGPTDVVTGLRRQLVGRGATAYLLDPAGPATPIAPAASAHIEHVGTETENGYESDVAFLRLVPPTNSSFTLPLAVYEVRARATVGGGDASSEARALVYRYVNRNTNLNAQRHAR